MAVVEIAVAALEGALVEVVQETFVFVALESGVQEAWSTLQMDYAEESEELLHLHEDGDSSRRM